MPMPCEVVQIAVQYLSLRDRMWAASLVNSVWREACLNSVDVLHIGAPWRDVSEEGLEGMETSIFELLPNVHELFLGPLSNPSVAVRHLRAPGNLRKLFMRGGFPLPPIPRLEALLIGNQTLEVLVEDAEGAEDASVLSHFPNVTELEMLSLAKASDWKALNPALTSLNLSFVSSAALLSNVQHLAQLRQLVLGQCTELSPKAFLAIAKSCPHLEVLDISGTTIPPYPLQQILTMCTKLHTLNLNGCEGLPHFDGGEVPHRPPVRGQVMGMGSLFAELKANTTKTGVHVPAAMKDDDAAAASGEQMKVEGGHLVAGVGTLLTQAVGPLRELNLGNVGTLDNTGMRMVLSLPHLEHLRVNKNKFLTDAAFVGIGDTKIKVLSVEGCTQITDAALREIAQIKGLNFLSVSNCVGISAAGLLDVLKSCQELETLWCFVHPAHDHYLTEQVLITPEVLEATFALPKLCTFGTSSQTLNFEGVCHRRLERLNLQQCKLQGDHAAVVRAFPNLRYLNARCMHATPAVLEALRESGVVDLNLHILLETLPALTDLLRFRRRLTLYQDCRRFYQKLLAKE